MTDRDPVRVSPSALNTGGDARCLLVSDLHGDTDKYEALFSFLMQDPPDAFFFAGDLLPQPGTDPGSLGFDGVDFVNRFLVRRLVALRRSLGERYPDVFVILGNDDVRFEEGSIFIGSTEKIWTYIHGRCARFHGRSVYGYSCIPPSPFRLKDWERYDVSRYVDPGCVSPEEGVLTVPMSARDRRHTTITSEIASLIGDDDVSEAIFLFHVPPYDTALDTADLDGKTVDGVPLDPHIGSVAVRRMIEERQPYITLHGHVHESYDLTRTFVEKIGRTWCISSAHEGASLVVVEFMMSDPGAAKRRVLG